MGEKWRVTVERWAPETEELSEGWTEVATLAASREQLARFAPGVVADALGVNTANVVHAPVTVTMNNSDATFTPAPATGGIVFQDERPEDVPKRKRRTRAQIEADRLREQETARAAIERLTQFPASVPSYQQDAAEVAVTNAGPDAYPTAPGEPEVPFVPDGASVPGAVATSVMASAGGGPFNPFAPK